MDKKKVKEMSVGGFLGILLSILLFLTVLMTYGSAQAAEKVITIYAMGDYSGVMAGITPPGLGAHRDVMKYWEKNNLIPGATYRLEWADSGGVLSRSAATFRRFKLLKPKPLLIVIAGTGEAEALKPLFEEAKIVLLSWSSSIKICHPVSKYAFGDEVSYPDQFGFFIDYISKNWDYAKMGRNPRVGILTWDTGFGRGFESPVTMAYAVTKKVDIITPFQFAPLSPIDVSTQLLSLDRAGADYIYSCVVAPMVATTCKDLVRLGLKNKIKYFGASGAGDKVTQRLAKDEELEGFTSTHSWKTFDEDPNSLMVKLFKENKRKPEDMGTGYPFMVTGTMKILEAYRRAILRVGWDGLTSDALSEALESLKDFDGGSSWVTYSPTRHSQTKIRMVQWQKGKLLPITDWMEAPDMNPR